MVLGISSLKRGYSSTGREKAKQIPKVEKDGLKKKMRHDKNVVLWIILPSGVTLGQAPGPPCTCLLLCYQELRVFCV